MEPRLASNSWSSYLHLPSTGITDVSHHAEGITLFNSPDDTYELGIALIHSQVRMEVQRSCVCGRAHCDCDLAPFSVR